jgi:hypothetical protein
MFNTKQDVMTQAFNAAGFDDVNYDDVASARRSDDREWEIVIDRSGQLKATITGIASKPAEHALDVLGRKAAVLVEKTVTTTVMFKLNDASELGKVLEALEAV